MRPCLTTPLAASVAGELRLVFRDLKTIAREIVRLSTELSDHEVLGVPVDRWCHFLVAAGLCLVALRFVSRWKAVALTLGPMLLKEAFDVPAKLKFLAGHGPLEIATDSAWDFTAGLAGIGAALLLAAGMGERWRAAPADRPARPLPPFEKAPRSGSISNAALVAAVGVAGMIPIGFELAALSSGRGLFLWLPHVVAAGGVLFACSRFGPGRVLLVLLPALPVANYLHRGVATDKLNVGTTMILALFAWEAVRRLRSSRPGRWVRGADRGVLAYAVYAVAIVVVNSFRLGWTMNRAYWLIPPVTGLAVYLLAREVLSREGVLRPALGMLAGAFVLLAVGGIVEFAVRPRRLSVVPGSVFGGAPLFAVYLSLFWPFITALALSRRAPVRWLFRAGAVLGIVPIVLVYNRSAWVAVVVGLGVVLVGRLFARDWVLGLGAACMFGLGVGIPVWAARSAAVASPNAFRSRCVRRAVSVLKPGSYKLYRGPVVESAGRRVRSSPLLGSTGPSAHTLHQAHAINYGIPGTVLAAAAVLGVLAWGWRGALGSREPLALAVAAGATASFAAAVVQGMGWSSLVRSSMQPLFWYLLALVPASLEAVRAGGRPPVPGAEAVRAAPPHGTPAAGLNRAERRLLLGAALFCLLVFVVLLWAVLSL